MFRSKEVFRREFIKEVAKTYGRSLEEAHLDEIYAVLGKMIRENASLDWKKSKNKGLKDGQKQLIYFSMEFLTGRMMRNNLLNLGVYDIVDAVFKDLSINLNDVLNVEKDAGLGNGGLGRLAACYMDSLASLGYLGHGDCIRYDYGFFRQIISPRGEQIEVPDRWLKLGNVWEVKKPHRAVDVAFYGRVEADYSSGRPFYRLVDAEYVSAVPYDMPIIGYRNRRVNTLRLWSAEPADKALPKEKDFYEYLSGVKRLCHGLYPDDSTENGKILRLKQQYFLVSAGIQSQINLYLKSGRDLARFADYVVFQLNDTHPVLGIPEMTRILIDEYGYEWDQAWEIVTHTFAYTNHTVMREALEKWPERYLSSVVPRVYMIIQEIDRRFRRYVLEKFNDPRLADEAAIIKDGSVNMTHLAAVGSFSINGVASLHTEILKTQVLAPFYRIYPEKFHGITNGVTHRRFLASANPELKALLDSTIGEEWIRRPSSLKKLLSYVDDEATQEKFAVVKKTRKKILADYIKRVNGIDIDVDSLYIVQAKRLHAYKRQTLNVLQIIALYQKLLENPQYYTTPKTFIFGAKAAPSYAFAKKVIELINCVARKINADERVNQKLKVVFIANYDVSKAEIIMPACDVSVQISLAGKEASGTGNMKAMMNGALTLGTYDGANIEIANLVGFDRCAIFGLREEEARELRAGGRYDVKAVIEKDPVLKKALISLIDGTFDPDPRRFAPIYDEIVLKNDEYFIAADFEAYLREILALDEKYANKKEWLKTSLINIAQSGYFSSDRAVEEYAATIWDLKKVK